MRIVRLTTCNTAMEANTIKHLLENEDIACFLTNQNFTNLLPIYNGMLGSGIQVMIREKDLNRAQELIVPASQNKITCPNCGSENIELGLGKTKAAKVLSIAISLFHAIPFGNIRSAYVCSECSAEFER